MPGLLSPAQIAQWEAAVDSVTDTFFNTVIRYYRKTVSLDPYQEDQDVRKTDIWLLNGLVTPVEWNSTLVEIEANGARALNENIVTLAMKDLLLIPGVIELPDYVPNMDPTTDYLSIGTDDTTLYRVLKVSKHGPMTVKDSLVKVRIRLEETILPQ